LLHTGFTIRVAMAVTGYSGTVVKEMRVDFQIYSPRLSLTLISSVLLPDGIGVFNDPNIVPGVKCRDKVNKHLFLSNFLW